MDLDLILVACLKQARTTRATTVTSLSGSERMMHALTIWLAQMARWELCVPSLPGNEAVADRQPLALRQLPQVGFRRQWDALRRH